MKRNRFLTIITFGIIASTLMLSSCNKKADPITKTDFYFDTTVSITVYDKKYSNYIDDCFDMCADYENKFSSTIENSEIYNINNNSHNEIGTYVSDDTLQLIKKGIEFGNISNGKFDITVGGLFNLWDFSGETNNIPDKSLIDEAVKHVNYNNISINGNEIILTDKSSSIELGGIAKGFIADKLKEYLVSKKVDSAIINLGGNVLLIGEKSDNSNFKIGIQKPFGSSDDTISVVSTSNKSIVSSGVYERYFYSNDKLYHHILDVSTGLPTDNELLGVTIISDASVDGDGYSTTAFLYGLDKGLELINNTPGIEAVFVDKDYELHLTSGLKISDNVISLK